MTVCFVCEAVISNTPEQWTGCPVDICDPCWVRLYVRRVKRAYLEHMMTCLKCYPASKRERRFKAGCLDGLTMYRRLVDLGAA